MWRKYFFFDVTQILSWQFSGTDGEGPIYVQWPNFSSRSGAAAGGPFEKKKSPVNLNEVHRYRPQWPDWVNLRPLGNCLLLAVFVNCRRSPNFVAAFFHVKSRVINFDKKMEWATIRATFSQTRLATLISADYYRVARWCVLKPKIPIWGNLGGSCNGNC
jgi:hypothetical protein